MRGGESAMVDGTRAVRTRTGARPMGERVRSVWLVLALAVAQLLLWNGVLVADAGVEMLDPADWSVWPSSQLNQNNLTLDVHGSAFFATNVSACRVGDFVTPLTHVSSELVRCTIYPSLRFNKGFAYVEVSMNGFDFTSDGITFALHDPVTLEQIFPYGWDKSGGAVLRVSGSNFSPTSSKCAFGAGGTGNVPAVSGSWPSVVVSSAFMKCETPAFTATGMTDVSLRTWGDSGSLSGSRAFEVWEEPCSIEIQKTWNSSKAEYGGVSVLLQGVGNEDLVEPMNMFGYSCHFGTITVRAVMDTLLVNRTVTCISPAAQHPGSSVDLWAGPNVDSFRPCTTYPSFSYPADSEDASAEVPGDETLVNYTGTDISVMPVHVASSGGSLVTVTGTSLSKSSVCRIESVTSAPVRFVSSALISCELPDYAEGDALFYTSSSGAGLEATSVYFAPLFSISSLAPDAGALEGGSMMRVTGSNFKDTADLSCRFGTVRVVASYFSTTKIDCVSPAHSQVVVPLGVGRVNIDSTVFSDSVTFEYNVTELLAGVLPPVVSNVGDTTLSLIWSEVYAIASTGCSLGAGMLNPCVVSGSTSPGFVEVYSYRFETAPLVSEPAVFAYYTSPILSSAIPAVIQNKISTVVYMIGSGFINANALCRFGSDAVDATFVSSALVKCTSHLVGNAGTADAQVGFGSAGDDGVWSRTVVSVSAVTPLTVSSVTPTRGVLAGGTVVSVTGSGFEGVGIVYCGIGTISYIEGRTIQDKLLECVSPTYFDEVVDIRVAILGNVYAETAQTFTYSTGIEVVAVIPSASPLSGGSAISIFGLAGDVSASYDCVMDGTAVSGIINRFAEVECTNPSGEEGFNAVGIGSVIDDYTDQVTMEYVRAPVMTSVYPLNGPTSGGTLIYISGAHFRSSAYLSLKGSGSSSHFVSSALIVSELPASDAAVFAADVKMNGNLASNKLTFTSRAPTTLSAITPTAFAGSGGSVIDVTGSSIPNDRSLLCLFGTVEVSAQWSSSTEMNCVSPVHTLDNSTEFRIFADGMASATSITVSYVAESTVDYILPRSLSAAQLPSSTTIFGDWLYSASCDGTVLAHNTTWSASFACTIEPTSVGYTSVSVISRGHTFSVSYMIKESPLLLGVAPPGISNLPGEIVTVSTRHMISGDADEFQCLFDASNGVVPYVVSSALIRCESIATTKTTERLSIIGGEGAYALTRQSAPTASSISPTSSGDGGGTLISLKGTSMPLLDNAAVCSFGTIGPVSSQFVSTTEVRCTSPAAVSGSSVDICVSVYGVLSPSISCVLTHNFTAADVLAVVLPPVVSNVGNTTLSLIWSELYSSGTACKTGSSLLDPCVVSGSTSPGFVEVYSYRFETAPLVSEPAVFAYYTSPILSSAIPAVIQNKISTVVYMIGSGFINANALCRFGSDAVDATFVSSALVKCTSHLVGNAGTADAQVGFGSAGDDGVWSRTVVSVSAVTPLTVSSVTPTRGVLAGGTVVSVTGSGFEGVGIVYCGIGTISYIEGRTIQDKLLECVSPTYFDEVVDIRVAILGNVYAETAQTFTYSTGIEVVAVIPSASPLSGGSAISIFGLAGDVSASYDCVMDGTAVSGIINRFAEVECTNPSGEEGFNAVGIGSVIDDYTDQVTMEYVRAPVMTSVYPLNGPTSGGTLIYISGAHFRSSAYLSLKGSGSSSHFVSSALIVSELPASDAAVFAADVKMNGNLASNKLTFTSRAPTTLSAITPTAFAGSGGSVIDVTGSSIPNDRSLLCLFGTVEVSAQWSSSTEMNCVSPVHTLDNSTEFRIFADGMASATSITVSYVAESTVDYILPRSLSAAQLPSSTTIFGDWLYSASCDGTVLAHNTTWSASFACTIEPTSVGYTSVSVISRGHTFSVSYMIKESPLLLGVAPPGISNLPGEIVTVSTRHMISGDADEFQCLFDASNGVVPYVVSSALIRCESIATTKTTERLSIIGGEGAYALTRQSAPTASSISPTSSGDGGGTLISLKGTSMPLLDNAAVCSFGTIGPVSSQFVSTTEVRCTSPAAVSGSSVDICVSVYGVLSPSRTCASTAMSYAASADAGLIVHSGVSDMLGGYLYLWRSLDSYALLPTLSSLSVGAVNATLSPTITGVYSVPQVSAGFVPVSAIAAAGGLAFDQVLVQPLASILSTLPQMTPSSGGGQVWVTGSNLMGSGLRVSVDNAEVGYVRVSSTLLVIETPSHAAGASTLQTSLGEQVDGDGAAVGPSSSSGLDYIDGIDLTRISSSIGPTSGSQTVSVFGEGFSDTSQLACRFGTLAPITANYVTGKEIRCAIPAHMPGQVPVEVTANGRDFTFNSTIPSNGAVWGTSTYYYWSAVPNGTPTTYRDITYTFTEAPASVDYVVPARSPIYLPTVYTIYGSGLDGTAIDTCSSLNITSRTISSTDEYVQCSWGATSVAGFVQVGVYAIISTYTSYSSEETQFEYYEPQTVTHLDPYTGPKEGGTILSIYGTNFRQEDFVNFAGVQVSTRVVSSALSMFEVPLSSSAGVKTVYASTYANAASTSFTALDQLELSDLSPSSSPAHGGQSLEITGDKLSAPWSIWCRAGTIGPFQARPYGSQLLRCVSPAHVKEDVLLQISMNKRDWVFDELITLTYSNAASVEHVLPSAGHVTDDTAIVEAFYSAPYPVQNAASRGCLPGGTFLLSETVDTSALHSMLCTLRRDSFIQGMYPIIATGPDAANSSYSAIFQYSRAPVIDAWSSPVIYSGGGTLVSFEVADAAMNGLACAFSPWYQNSFSSTVVADARFVSSALVVCESPPAEQGENIGISIGLHGTVSETGQAEVLSIDRPSISTVMPDSLLLSGGTSILITGDDLGLQIYDLYASFGPISPLGLRWVTTQQVEAISPATTQGSKSIYLAHSLSATSDAYSTDATFFTPFEPSALIPSVVPSTDNAFVRLHAAFGSIPASIAACDPTNPTFTLCREAVNIGGVLSRTHAPGFTILDVPGASNVTANVPQISYVETSTSTTAQPPIAVAGGGSVILVAGSNFIQGMTSVRIGDVVLTVPQSSLSWLSSSLIRFEAPEGDHDAKESIYTSTAYTDSDSWGMPGGIVTYYSLPRLTNSSGAIDVGAEGGRIITVTGSQFKTTRDLFCKFGEVHARATLISANSLTCVAPALGIGASPLRVSNNMLDYSSYLNIESSSDDTHNEVTTVEDFISQLESVSGAFGSSSGGSLVKFMFAQAPPAVLGCKFFTRVGNAVVLDSGNAVCVTPSNTAGFAPIQLSAGNAPGAVFGNTGVQFEFQSAPELDVIFPEIGLVGGGTLLNVHGDNLIQSLSVAAHGSTLMPGSTVRGLSCRFGGGYTVGAIHVSSTIMRCEAPAFSNALVDQALIVDVSTNAQEWTGSQIAFELVEEMNIRALSPIAGTRAGGTSVTIAGGYFSPDTPVWCKFGTTGPIHALFHGDGSVRCKSPAKGEGDIPVAISRGNAIDFAFDHSSIFKM